MKATSKILASIRTRSGKRKLICEVRYTTNMLRFAKILRYYNFIYGFVLSDRSDKIRIFLRYSVGRPAIGRVKVVSKPGARRYLAAKSIIQQASLDPSVVFVVSNSSGLCGYPQLDKKTPPRSGLNSGEFICKIW